jgi:hypothetical protein
MLKPAFRLHSVWLVAAIVCSGLITPAALAQSARAYSVDHVIEFKPGTRQALAAYASLPDVAEITSAPEFSIAKEDLDGDGAPELIVQSQATAYCGNGGCLTLVLGMVNRKPTLLLAQNQFSPLALTREKPNGYRALAALDAQGAIPLGDRPGTPLHRKPLVYPMTVAASPTAAKPANSKAQRVCTGGAPCTESSELALVVTSVRESRWDSTHTRFITVNARIQNKTNRPLVLGYDKSAALVVDDAGNRYSIHSARGIPHVSQGQTVDTSFVIPAGEASDVRFEFYWQGREIFGTVYDLDLSIREIVMLGNNQVRFGKEHALNLSGLRSGTAATTAAAAAPPAAPGAPPAEPAAAVASTDACAGAVACVVPGPFSAQVVRLLASQPSQGPVNATRVYRYDVRFRNLTDKPLILAHDPETAVVIDTNGNRYGYWNPAINIAGMGQVRGYQIDTSFALQPGEARSATFEVRYVYDSRKSVPSDTTSFDLAVQEVEELASQQLRVVREHTIAFENLTPRIRAAGTNDAQPATDAKELVEGLKKLFKKKP